MNIDFLLKKGLVVNGIIITDGFRLDDFETLVEDYFINSNEENTKIITFQEIEFCFVNQEISYWQIENDSDKKIDKELQAIFKMNFNSFLKLLESKEIVWDFNTKLCFSNQLSVRIKNTLIEFLFDFEDKTEGELAIIGHHSIFQSNESTR